MQFCLECNEKISGRSDKSSVRTDAEMPIITNRIRIVQT